MAPGSAALIGGELGEEGGGGHDQGHVALPTVPGSGPGNGQAEVISSAQEAFLDGPAQARRSGQFPERSAFTGMSE